MPFVKSIVSKRRTRIISLILLLSEIISPYSHYIEKKLIYITIAALSSRQPFSYSKCIKLNIRLFCNIYLIFNNKYISLASLCTF